MPFPEGTWKALMSCGTGSIKWKQLLLAREFTTPHQKLLAISTNHSHWTTTWPNQMKLSNCPATKTSTTSTPQVRGISGVSRFNSWKYSQHILQLSLLHPCSLQASSGVMSSPQEAGPRQTAKGKGLRGQKSCPPGQLSGKETKESQQGLAHVIRNAMSCGSTYYTCMDLHMHSLCGKSSSFDATQGFLVWHKTGAVRASFTVGWPT